MSRSLKFKGALCATTLAVMSLAAHADLARVGPLDVPSPTGNGFPLWYQDLTGTALDLCLPAATDPGALQQTACLQPTAAPYTFPTVFPSEIFYFRAVSNLSVGAGGKKAVLVLAHEGSFTGGTPVAGQQMVFTRIRVTAGVPEVGTYTVVHPYGVEPNIDVPVVGTNRDINVTEDVGVGANLFSASLVSRVGPYLKASATEGGAALPPVTLNGAQFLSDAVTPVTVTGSPFNTNFFMICGVRANGTNIPLGTATFGTNTSCAKINTFTLTGKVHNAVAAPIGSPLTVLASTYSRDAAGTHVNVSAQVARALPTQPVPLLTAASTSTPPVRFVGPDALDRYFTEGFTNPAGDLPGPITVTNSGDNPPTSVIAGTRDVINVTSTAYNSALQTLTVVATSSDKGFGTSLPPTLTLVGIPNVVVTPGGIAGDPASATLVASGLAVAPPAVRVGSTGGGILEVPLTTNPNVAFAAGSPFTVDDTAVATAAGPAVVIPVLANDLANAAAPINPASVTILPGSMTPATLGTAVVNATGTVTFTPGGAVGTGSFKYTVSSAAVPGASNVGTVNVTINAPAGGAVPLGTADSFSTLTNVTRNFNVAANDSGNGGTLNPASVQLVAGSVTGGTATVAADGTVNYASGGITGNFGFSYTVANTTGVRSAAIPVTVVIASEPLGVTAGSTCTRAQNRWKITGTGAVPNTVITLFNTAVAPAAPTAAQTVGSGTALATGAWTIDVTGGPVCGTVGSIRSASGTVRNNLVFTLK